MSNPFDTSSNSFDEDNYNSSTRKRIQKTKQEIIDACLSRELESTRRALACIDDTERTSSAAAEVIGYE